MSLAASDASDLAILSTEVTLVGLLAIAAAVAMVVSRIKVPFTVALVLAGLALSFTTAFDIHLSKELILGVLVPPLVFEATMHLPWHRLRTDLVAILTLAIGGTLIGTFLVGVLIRPFVDVPWPAALAFGALVSATDPVAVIARFRSLGVDKRLTTLVEGESLFNDGAAIVIFGLAAAGSAGFTVGGAVGEFLKVSVGGLAVGAVLGYLVSRVLLKHLDDHLLETAITLALAFGSYVVAEKLHISGILAVVAAGIIVGEVGLENTSPTTRLSLESFWELLSFIVNAFVFLLIGLRIDIAQMSHHVPAILVAVVTILVARAVIVYGTSLVQNRISATRYLPRSFQHAVYWGGLRGRGEPRARVDAPVRVRRSHRRGAAGDDFRGGPVHPPGAGHHDQVGTGPGRDLPPAGGRPRAPAAAGPPLRSLGGPEGTGAPARRGGPPALHLADARRSLPG